MQREIGCSLRLVARWRGWLPICSVTNVDPTESSYAQKAEKTDAPERRIRAFRQWKINRRRLVIGDVRLLARSAHGSVNPKTGTDQLRGFGKPGRTARGQIEAGLEYAAAIIEDRIGVLSYYGGSQFAGSRSVKLPRPDSLPSLYEGIGLAEKLAFFIGGWDRVTLRSWSGRFDREEIQS